MGMFTSAQATRLKKKTSLSCSRGHRGWQASCLSITVQFAKGLIINGNHDAVLSEKSAKDMLVEAKAKLLT